MRARASQGVWGVCGVCVGVCGGVWICILNVHFNNIHYDTIKYASKSKAKMVNYPTELY